MIIFRIFKWLLTTAVALVILGVIFLLVAPFVFSGEKLKENIVLYAKQKSGIDISFTGKLDYSIILNPVIKADGLVIQLSGGKTARLNNVVIKSDIASIIAAKPKGIISFNSNNLDYIISADKSGNKYSIILESPVTLSAIANIDNKRKNEINISDITIFSNNSKAVGNINFRNDEVKGITGELKFSTLDVTEVLNIIDVLKSPFISNYSTPSDTASANTENSELAAAALWPITPIKLDFLKNILADVAISAESIKFSEEAIGSADVKINIDNNVLKIENSNSQIFSGTLRSLTTVKEQEGKILFGHAVEAEDIDLEKFVSAISKDSKLNKKLFGKGNIDLKLKALGENQSELISSMLGTGSVEVTEGGIKGLDIKQIQNANNIATLLGSEGQVTDIQSLIATFTIQDGVINNEDLDVSTTLGKFTGKGLISLPVKEVNYTLIAAIRPEGAEHNFVKVPVTISGKFSNLQVTPDVKAFAVDGINRILNNDSLMDKIDKQLERKLNLPEGSAEKLLQNLNNSLQNGASGGEVNGTQIPILNQIPGLINNLKQERDNQETPKTEQSPANPEQQNEPAQNQENIEQKPTENIPEGYYVPVPQNSLPTNNPTTYGGGMMLPLPKADAEPADTVQTPEGYYSKQQESDKAMEAVRAQAMEKLFKENKTPPQLENQPRAVQVPNQPAVAVPSVQQAQQPVVEQPAQANDNTPTPQEQTQENIQNQEQQQNVPAQPFSLPRGAETIIGN